MVRVGGHIKRLREERGWSQPRLAVEAGVAVSAVSQIENGRRSPNVSTLDKLAEAFGVEVADFFPKARSSSLEPSLFNDLEDEQREDAYELARNAARDQATQNRQAFNRAVESESPQTYFMAHENDAVEQLSRYPSDELAAALLQTAAAREEERSSSILAKAVAVGAERWADITSSGGPDGRESAFGIYRVAADLKGLLNFVMEDHTVWEKLSGTERAEIAGVVATLGRLTESYRDRRDEEQAAKQRRAMTRQLTREIAKSA
jgi:transcriptional regulator with XRE-family HTH domain